MLSAIGEHLVSLFKYWGNGSIQEGMNYRGQLYALVRSHAIDAQWEAYELGRELAQTGIGTCLTFSAERFAVWIDLKSLPASFASQGGSPNVVNFWDPMHPAIHLLIN